MENENKVSMMDVTVTGEVEIHSDPVSYTHLDVYKRQD